MAFHSDFADVIYIREDNAVCLTWKREAHLEDYRMPTRYALRLLGEHPLSCFIVDARNGFEDDARDVVWGFQTLLPAMAATGCKYVVFIMEQVNDIEGEMDMWTAEFSKYFIVRRATDYAGAVSLIRSAAK